MYSTITKLAAIRSSLQLNRSYGIVTSIHLFGNNNNNQHGANIAKPSHYEVECTSRKCTLMFAVNTLTTSSTAATPTPQPTVSNALIQSNSKLLKRFYSKPYKSKRKHDEYLESESDSDSDSDDERGHKKKRGNTDFWRRKMRTLHGLLDVNNDGVISYDDFKLLADSFTSLGHLDAEHEREFIEVLRRTWEAQWGEPTPYNLINIEQYLTEMHHAINDHELRDKIHHFLPFLFKAVDKDGSGFISLNEFKLFFQCLGLTPEDAAVSFAVIDENGDGKLSIKEFVKLGREFFLSEDERHVSRMFWGPLAKGR